jgi:hypothetical protein
MVIGRRAINHFPEDYLEQIRARTAAFRQRRQEEVIEE